MPYAWDHRDLLAALASLGVRPAPGTRPALVKDFVSALYQYELRRLRAQLARGDFPKPEYAGRVAALRPKYWMLSIPAAKWAAAMPEDR